MRFSFARPLIVRRATCVASWFLSLFLEIENRYGIRVVTGSLEKAQFSSCSFDLVHMSHVLEHVHDPISVLQGVRRILKPEGRLIVEVPNELENVYTWVRLRSGTARTYPVKSSHLWFFSPSTLQRVIRAAGFSLELRRSFRDASDSSPLRRLPKAMLGTFERLVDRGPLIEAIARPESA